MNEEKWVAWEVQTSRRLRDVEDVLKYTNIDFIDYDHRILIEYALELNHLIKKSEMDFSLELIQETSMVLNKFYDYAVEHFNREEVFMDLYCLPGDELHKREHGRILKMLRTSLDDFSSGKIKISSHLKTQVMDWLINHVNSMDYNFFNIENWSDNLLNARGWDDVKDIINMTGVDAIDSQHKELTEIAINLITAIEEEKKNTVLMKMFDNFIAYANMHFNYEAEFMKKNDIEEEEKHLELHDFFINRLEEFKASNLQDKMEIKNMKSWILKWWINHINLIDKQYFTIDNWAHKLIQQAENMDELSMILRRTDIEAIDQDHIHLMEVTLKLNRLVKVFGGGLNYEKSNQLKRLNEFIKIKKELNTQSDESKTYEELVKSYLTEVYEIAKQHFKREEEIMDELKLRDRKSHVKEHKAILEKLHSILENYEEGRLYVSSNLKTMIIEWWIGHTNTTDYRTFVQGSVRSMLDSIDKTTEKEEGQELN